LIRPVSLIDIPLISKLQHQGIQLDLKRALTRPESPLAVALRAPLSFGQLPSLTYIGRRGTPTSYQTGFVQLRGRQCERPQADIAYIAPALASDSAIGTLWTELLNAACWEAGQYGVQQVFADLPADSENATPFLNAGFMIFAREELLRCEQLTLSEIPKTVSVRPQSSFDPLALHRLYAAIVPIGVKQAEGAFEMNGSRAGLASRSDTDSYLFEARGEIVGHLEVTRGKVGHSIHLAIHPDKVVLVDDLVEAGLHLLKDAEPLPIYSHIRTYQSFLKPALSNRGFEVIDRRDLAVRQTLARSEKPVVSGMKVLDSRPEVSVTPTFSPYRVPGKRIAGE